MKWNTVILWSYFISVAKQDLIQRAFIIISPQYKLQDLSVDVSFAVNSILPLPVYQIHILSSWSDLLSIHMEERVGQLLQGRNTRMKEGRFRILA